MFIEDLNNFKGIQRSFTPKCLRLPYAENYKGSQSFYLGNSLVVSWLGLCAFTARGRGLIPGWGTKILQATSWSVSLVAQSCPTLCDLMDCSTPGLPVHHQLPELTQTPVHWVGDAIQPSHPLSFPSPPAFNLSQHQGLFHWVSSSHQVAKVLEFQLQHQFCQWTYRNDSL